ncbi:MULTISPECIES: N-acetylmuramic acid 6-phosphate etherase [Serratia]|uniref:N-acetylmuramic acid 6-phosphate etherase n=1 Tax=Serratia TaxID=613 RepID=UPI001013C48D|nr:MULTISPECIES: N-acetylmuramic acid 6-phosphate etherase [Serratia]CAI1807699.1 N-acetylmuramic acid 6-phosphate etherase [Serratia ficaria]
MQLENMVTEGVNRTSFEIDRVSTLEMCRIINDEDKKVPQAVELVLPQIAAAVDIIYEQIGAGGRLIYTGAGTSGRLGILDASECPPTYGVAPDLVIGLIAGGERAIQHAIEGAEDSLELGVSDLKALNLTEKDVVVGIAASGRTPYVIAALNYARQTGCHTIGISCNPGSAVSTAAELAITPVVGPEVVSGSSRMKAGTAQKLILNMLSSGLMIKSGKVFGNLMVDVVATNEKLYVRQVNIVRNATGCTDVQAESTLRACDHHCKTAIVMLLKKVDVTTARRCLEQHGGYIRRVLEEEPR